MDDTALPKPKFNSRQFLTTLFIVIFIAVLAFTALIFSSQKKPSSSVIEEVATVSAQVKYSESEITKGWVVYQSLDEKLDTSNWKTYTVEKENARFTMKYPQGHTTIEAFNPIEVNAPKIVHVRLESDMQANFCDVITRGGWGLIIAIDDFAGKETEKETLQKVVEYYSNFPPKALDNQKFATVLDGKEAARFVFKGIQEDPGCAGEDNWETYIISYSPDNAYYEIKAYFLGKESRKYNQVLDTLISTFKFL